VRHASRAYRARKKNALLTSEVLVRP
jgi:hypothetical protein